MKYSNIVSAEKELKKFSNSAASKGAIAYLVSGPGGYEILYAAPIEKNRIVMISVDGKIYLAK